MGRYSAMPRRLLQMLTLLPAMLWLAASQPTSAHAQGSETSFKELSWEELSNRDLRGPAEIAIGLREDRWRHAETTHFILHFRRVTEARKVAREIEFAFDFVVNALHADPNAHPAKSHVFIFEDESDWRVFRVAAKFPDWMSSVASGDDLFLNIRQTRGGLDFRSTSLNHEAAHAVIARLYGRRYWPLWLNEGFAEYVGGASIAARKNQSLNRHQEDLPLATLSPTELQNLEEYPDELEKVGDFYASSQLLTRFLLDELPAERFPQLVDRLVAGESLEIAIPAVYADRFPEYPAFLEVYERYRPKPRKPPEP